MNTMSTKRTVWTDKKEGNNIVKKQKYLIQQCYIIIDFIVHVSSLFLQSILRCLCFISFPSVLDSLFLFYLISFSPCFIDHVSFLFSSVHSQFYSFHLSYSISFKFTLFGFTCITSLFNLIVSFTFQPILSLEIKHLRVYLDKFLILYRYSLLEAELSNY